MPEEVSDQGSRVVSRLYMPQVALCSSPLPPCALAAKSTAERAGNPRGVDYPRLRYVRKSLPMSSRCVGLVRSMTKPSTAPTTPGNT
jgi:hypothetical protein